MSTRRTSTRLSTGHQETQQDSMSVARKRGGSSEEVMFPSAEEKKKRRKEAKKQPMFKPQPVHNSSDTPPDEEPIDLPPPPSEKRIARRRESTRAIRERAASTSPTRDREAGPVKRQKLMGLSDPSKSAQSQPSSSSLTQSLVSANAEAGPSNSTSVTGNSMAPPATTGFVRKTRKSMRGMSFGQVGEGSLDSVVPIPENETPMIRKNKELREAQSRRSSFGMRGQRASSSLGRGEISIPHPSVDHKLFFTHLGSSMPEPIRARHLIAWCAKRAVDDETGKKSKTKGKDRTSDGDRIVKEIMDEVIMSLGKGNIDTNVFAQVPSGSTGMLRPHPRNVANRELHDQAEAVIKRSKEENNQWARLVNHTNTRLHATINRMKEKKAKDELPDVTGTGWMEDALKLADGILAEGDGDLTKMGEFEDVEFKVDSLLSSTHVAVQYSRQSQLFLDGIFSSLAADLRRRENPATTSRPADTDVPDTVTLLSTAGASNTGTKDKGKGKDPLFMLRALASADSKLQNDEAIAAAAKVAPIAPVSAASASGLNASVGPGVTATPRRIGQATPRRVGQGERQHGPTPRSVRGVKVAEEAE